MATAVKERASLSELWKTYDETRSLELRNELVLRYAGLVRSIVRRVASVSGNYADSEDLTSYGMLGLIKAIEKYDTHKGVAFETFAVYRIRGEIIDYIRRNDWVPRCVRKKATDFEKTISELANELGRQPDDNEIAVRLGIPGEELKQLYKDIEKFNLVSFEEIIYDNITPESNLMDVKTPEGNLQETELLEMLAAAIDAMPERERLIITLYYYEELTLKEISSIVGVSESRISQIHSKTIKKIRNILVGYVNG